MKEKKRLNGKNIISTKKKLILSLIFGGISLILLIMCQMIYGFGDWYNKYIYVWLVNTVCRIFSVVPFSVYEIILYSFIVYVLFRIVKNIYLLIKRKIKIKIKMKDILIRGASSLILYISIFVFLNMITQGVNCFKSSFAVSTNLDKKEVNKENLKELCIYLKDNLNELDKKIDKDEEGIFILENNYKEVGRENMYNLSKKYDCLKGFYPNPKSYIFSSLMSYQLLQGESTFTIEANYNRDMPKHNIPSTICHELSHIRGFNNEDEANYISFLSCINSEDYNYQYSGYIMAYVYCMDDLYYADKDAFIEISKDTCAGVKKELMLDDEFWQPYRGFVSSVYNFIYDKLLKMVGQKNGIHSYNGVVKLLVSGYGIQY